MHSSFLLLLLGVATFGHNYASADEGSDVNGSKVNVTTTAQPIIDVCPKRCNCSSMGNDSIVNCSRAMLMDVPMGIPNDTTVLDLSYNNITRLNGTNSALANLTELRLLYVMNNALDTVEAGAFKGCGKLSVINFSKNSLGNNGIEPSVFSDTAEQMDSLYFDRNNINENISAEMFQGIISVRRISFAYNDFTTLKKGVFNYTKGLTDVCFGFNHLKTIEDGVWEEVSNLTSIDLRYNDFNKLKYAMFRGLQNMNQLFLLGCPIVDGIEDGTFQDMTKLTHLALEKSGLSNLTPDLLKDLAELRNLTLQGNALEAVDGSVFQYSPLLENVLIQDNDISQITGSISSLNKLKEFDLSNNRIKTLDNGFFPENVTTSMTINLNMNPLHCNCLLNWTSTLAKNITIKGRCETPRKVNGRDLSKMGISDFVCFNPAIISMTGNITVSVGSNVTVLCAAEGDPLPTIIWQAGKIGVRKEIGPPSDDSLLSNDGSLTLTNFTQAYEGNYTCSAYSSLPPFTTRTITIKIGPNTTPTSEWKITYGQFVGSVVGAVIATLVITVVVVLAIGYYRSRKRAGYQQTI